MTALTAKGAGARGGMRPQSIDVERSLLRYDSEELLFLGRDESGGLHLVVWVDEEGDSPIHLALPLSEARYAEIETGRVALGAAFRSPEQGCLLVCRFDAGHQAVCREICLDDVASWLPDAEQTFYFEQGQVQ